MATVSVKGLMKSFNQLAYHSMRSWWYWLGAACHVVGHVTAGVIVWCQR